MAGNVVDSKVDSLESPIHVSTEDAGNNRILNGLGNGSFERNISAAHKTLGGKGNSLQNSTLNSSLERDIIATLDRESDSMKKGLVSDVMDSEVDGLRGRIANSTADAGNDRMLEGSGNGRLDRDVSALHDTSGNKGNSLQDSVLNSIIEKDIIANLDEESDSNDKGLVGNIMDNEVDSLGGWLSVVQQMQEMIAGLTEAAARRGLKI